MLLTETLIIAIVTTKQNQVTPDVSLARLEKNITNEMSLSTLPRVPLLPVKTGNPLSCESS